MVGLWERSESRGGPVNQTANGRPLVQAPGSLTAGASGAVPSWLPFLMQHPMRVRKAFFEIAYVVAGKASSKGGV